MSGELLREIPVLALPAEHEFQRDELFSKQCVALSRGGQLFGTGKRALVQIWDAKSGRELQRMAGHTEFVTTVAFSPDGRCLASGGDDGTVCLWDVESGRNTRRLDGHGMGVTCVAFSPDGRLLASGSWDGSTRLWGVSQ